MNLSLDASSLPSLSFGGSEKHFYLSICCPRFLDIFHLLSYQLALTLLFPFSSVICRPQTFCVPGGVWNPSSNIGLRAWVCSWFWSSVSRHHSLLSKKGNWSSCFSSIYNELCFLSRELMWLVNSSIAYWWSNVKVSSLYRYQTQSTRWWYVSKILAKWLSIVHIYLVTWCLVLVCSLWLLLHGEEGCYIIGPVPARHAVSP